MGRCQTGGGQIYLSTSVNEQLAILNLELRAIAESEYGSDCLSSSTVAEEPTTVYDVDADASEEY